VSNARKIGERKNNWLFARGVHCVFVSEGISSEGRVSPQTEKTLDALKKKGGNEEMLHSSRDLVDGKERD